MPSMLLVTALSAATNWFATAMVMMATLSASPPCQRRFWVDVGRRRVGRIIPDLSAVPTLKHKAAFSGRGGALRIEERGHWAWLYDGRESIALSSARIIRARPICVGALSKPSS